MTQVKFNNGSVVEDTFTNSSEGSEATEAYVWMRIMKDFAYSFDDSMESSDGDLQGYIDFLKGLEVNDTELGEIQRDATDFTTDDYLQASGLGTAIPLADANDTEQEVGKYVADSLSESNANLVNPDSLKVPTTPNGEAMPLFVASNERAAGLHTLEEAKDMWDRFVGHLDVEVTSSEPMTVESNDENSSSDSGNSDQEDFLLSEVNGVGTEVSDKIRTHIVENRVTVDWRNHIDGEEWHEAPTLITKEEAQTRLQAVAGDMPSGAFQMASDKIGEGDTDEAITLISDYE